MGSSLIKAGRRMRLAMALGIGASMTSGWAGAGHSWEILRSGQEPVGEAIESGDTILAYPKGGGRLLARIGTADWVAVPITYTGFTEVFEPPGPFTESVSVHSVAAFGGHYSLLGVCSIPYFPWETSGVVLGTSADGRTWQTRLAYSGTAYIHGYLDLKATGGRLLAFGGAGNSSSFGGLGYVSEDGVSWTRFEMHDGLSTPIYDVCGEGPAFVACGGGETMYGSRRSIMVSTNAMDWVTTYTVSDQGGVGSFELLAWGNGTYVTVTDFPNGAWISSDGVTWKKVSVPFPGWGPHPPRRLLFGAGCFLLFYPLGDWGPLTLGTSVDGREWAWQTGAEFEGIHDVAFGGGRFIAVGSQGRVMTSRDGLAWDTHEAPTTELLDWVGPGERGFLIAGQGGILIRFVPAPEVRLSISAGEQIEVQVSGDIRASGVLQSSTSLSPAGEWQQLATFVLGEDPWVSSFPNSGGVGFFRAVLDP